MKKHFKAYRYEGVAYLGSQNPFTASRDGENGKFLHLYPAGVGGGIHLGRLDILSLRDMLNEVLEDW